MILNSRPFVDEDELAAPAPLMSDMEDLQDQLEDVVDKLKTVGDYVRRVTGKQIEGDESIGWKIGEALSSVPNIEPSEFEDMADGQTVLPNATIVHLSSAIC